MPRPLDPKLFTIPASADFSAALARGILQRFGGGPLGLADTVIYLPTRRAARSIAEVFARAAGGATLLPEFRALGDVDEDELLLEAPEAFELKPAMAPLRRRLLLAALIRRWSHARDGGAMSFGEAAALARSLAAVMDECERAGADLKKLAELAPETLAEHWAAVKDFLYRIIAEEWPKLLAAENCLSPEDHRNRALRALARRLEEQPPAGPVITAGSTGSIPATAELIGVIARLPMGAVVLPGLDRELDAESWERMEPGHPQFTLKQLLERLGVARVQVADWTDVPGRPERERLLREVLRPAPTTDAWRALAESKKKPGVAGLSLFEAADPAEEAAVIALLLREALETKDRRAALVTRDRALARRVTAELSRWNIAIDDSAGRPLPHTAAGSFLCLLAEAAASKFAPVPLLALLKHPLAGDAAFRGRARELDLALRGPRPAPGLEGIAAALPPELQAWFAEMAGKLAPLEAALAPAEAGLAALLDAHLKAAEALAPALWNGPDGREANALMQKLKAAAEGLPLIETRAYAPLLAALAAEVAVRPPYGRHPRLAILGPLEARLLEFDLVVLGGLNEGSWPASAAGDPWFSRPMRRTLGLEQPERAIGLSAHDFAGLAAGPQVVLTRAAKAEGVPTVASRWVQRLQQLTAGLGLAEALMLPEKYRAYARALADPGPPEPEKPPRPAPPLAARPREMRVTEIETWVRDPYAVYARHILKLEKLDTLDAEIGPLERGTILHKAIERFLKKFPGALPPDAAFQLGLIADEEFAALPKALLALWRPRFLSTALAFVREETRRREAVAESFIETGGTMSLPGPGGAFTLKGRADRIDRLKAGGGAILDYKTGMPPSEKQVLAHLAPQLPLEAAMLAAGGFEPVGKLEPKELAYVRVGGPELVEFKPIRKAEAKILAQEAVERLSAYIAKFDRAEQTYDSRVGPQFARYASDYDHLARVKEWSARGWSGDEE